MSDDGDLGREPAVDARAPRPGGALRALRESNLKRILDAISTDGGNATAAAAAAWKR